MRGLLKDFRYGVRMLAKAPGFSAIAVLTLALGIGANTAIFSVVSPILFEPLPYPHASRLVMIWDIFEGSRSDVTLHTYRESTGIYGVLSGGVTGRFREIGIRSALGASRVKILSLVIGQGMILATLGSAIGLVAAAAVSPAMIALLFGVSRLDPITYSGVIVLLGGASAAACWAPAWRATKVDPMVALRYE